MGRVARDRSLSPNLGWLTDQISEFTLWKEIFTSCSSPEPPVPWPFGEKWNFLLTLQGEFIVWNKGREDKKKNYFVWLCLSGLGDLRSVFSVSLLQIRRLPPNNLYIAFLVSFLQIAYCLHGSIPRQIRTGFYSFAMQVISMRNILKGSFSLSLKPSFNPLKWSRVFSKCCWL